MLEWKQYGYEISAGNFTIKFDSSYYHWVAQYNEKYLYDGELQDCMKECETYKRLLRKSRDNKAFLEDDNV